MSLLTLVSIIMIFQLVYTFINGVVQNIYGSGRSQEVPARPSGKSRLETRCTVLWKGNCKPLIGGRLGVR